jgi:Domain of unknown function (DUF4905)
MPTWEYHARGSIWRLVVADSGLLVGEERDTSRRVAGFFCLNQVTGEALWHYSDPKEKWWIGIETTHRDHLFLHGYATPDMPGHKGIIAIDLFIGKVVWRMSEPRFLVASGETIFVSSDVGNDRTLVQLDAGTGEAVRYLNPHDKEFEEAFNEGNVNSAGVPELPHPIEFSEEFDARAEMLIGKQIAPENVIGAVECLVRNPLLIFSYHERMSPDQENYLRNSIAIVNMSSGSLLFSETLNSRVTSVAPESFFVCNSMLYFIRERTSLVAIRLDDLHG